MKPNSLFNGVLRAQEGWLSIKMILALLVMSSVVLTGCGKAKFSKTSPKAEGSPKVEGQPTIQEPKATPTPVPPPVYTDPTPTPEPQPPRVDDEPPRNGGGGIVVRPKPPEEPLPTVDDPIRNQNPRPRQTVGHEDRNDTPNGRVTETCSRPECRQPAPQPQPKPTATPRATPTPTPTPAPTATPRTDECQNRTHGGRRCQPCANGPCSTPKPTPTPTPTPPRARKLVPPNVTATYIPPSQVCEVQTYRPARNTGEITDLDLIIMSDGFFNRFDFLQQLRLGFAGDYQQCLFDYIDTWPENSRVKVGIAASFHDDLNAFGRLHAYDALDGKANDPLALDSTEYDEEDLASRLALRLAGIGFSRTGIQQPATQEPFRDLWLKGDFALYSIDQLLSPEGQAHLRQNGMLSPTAALHILLVTTKDDICYAPEAAGPDRERFCLGNRIQELSARVYRNLNGRPFTITPILFTGASALPEVPGQHFEEVAVGRSYMQLAREFGGVAIDLNASSEEVVQILAEQGRRLREGGPGVLSSRYDLPESVRGKQDITARVFVTEPNRPGELQQVEACVSKVATSRSCEISREVQDARVANGQLQVSGNYAAGSVLTVQYCYYQ